MRPGSEGNPYSRHRPMRRLSRGVRRRWDFSAMETKRTILLTTSKALATSRITIMNKLLFTPGPLTTSPTVKEAMLRDLGSHDAEFLEIVCQIRESLLALGNAARPDYECVLMQGSGTFAIESVI